MRLKLLQRKNSGKMMDLATLLISFTKSQIVMLRGWGLSGLFVPAPDKEVNTDARKISAGAGVFPGRPGQASESKAKGILRST